MATETRRHREELKERMNRHDATTPREEAFVASWRRGGSSVVFSVVHCRSVPLCLCGKFLRLVRAQRGAGAEEVAVAVGVVDSTHRGPELVVLEPRGGERGL